VWVDREPGFNLLLPSLAAVLALACFGPLVRAFVPLVVALGVAGVAWIGAVLIARRAEESLRVLSLVGDPGLSDDAHRIQREREVVPAGRSPYALAPADPGLAELVALDPRMHASVNHPDVPAAYPPLTQALGVATVAVGRALGVEDGLALVRRLRWVVAACVLLVLASSILLPGALGRPRTLAEVWGWSPLAALEGGVRAPWTGLGEHALQREGSGALHPFVRQPAEELAEIGGRLDPRVLPRAVAFVGAFLVLGPTLHPGYVTWVLHIVALGAFERRGRPDAPGWLGDLPWMWLAAGASLLDAPLAVRARTGAWEETAWLWPAVHLPFLALLIASLARRPHVLRVRPA
jgi:hypothetical protein